LASAPTSPASSSPLPATTPTASGPKPAFAKLSGSCPIPAGSGKTNGRHAPTIAYVERRTAEGLSKKEIIRCLKRYVAREVYALLPPPSTPGALKQAE
jgi:hypothetical protein